jgi:hypothetical protein
MIVDATVVDAHVLQEADVGRVGVVGREVVADDEADRTHQREHADHECADRQRVAPPREHDDVVVVGIRGVVERHVDVVHTAHLIRLRATRDADSPVVREPEPGVGPSPPARSSSARRSSVAGSPAASSRSPRRSSAAAW